MDVNRASQQPSCAQEQGGYSTPPQVKTCSSNLYSVRSSEREREEMVVRGAARTQASGRRKILLSCSFDLLSYRNAITGLVLICYQASLEASASTLPSFPATD